MTAGGTSNGMALMRMLYVAEFISPGYVGGSARYAHDLLIGMLSTPDCPLIDLVTRSPQGHYALNNSDELLRYFYQLGVKSLTALDSLHAALRCLRLAWRADSIVAHHPFVAAFLFCINPRHKLHYVFHGPLHSEYAAKTGVARGLGFELRKALQKLVLKRATKVYVLSDYMAQQATDLSPGVRIEKLGPIVAQSFFKDCGHKHEKRADKRRHLVCVRRLTPRTGVAELLETFTSLPDNDLLLHIVGVGELEEALIKRYGGDPRVLFHRFLSDTDMRELIKTADACILPSITLEGFGLVILEAYAAGVPIIVTTTSGGAAEFISRVDPRFIYDRMAGAESLRTAIDFATDYSHRENLVKIAKEYTPEVVAKKFLALMAS